MSGLSLEPPTPNAASTPDGDEFALPPEVSARIKAIAREFAGAFVSIDMKSPEFDRMTRQIAAIGSDEVRRLAGQSQKSITRTTIRERAIGAVNAQLARLRAVLEQINPGAGDELIKPKKFLGIFPRAATITSYFDRYQKAEGDIETALASMAQSRDMLLQDNIALEANRSASRPLISSLAEAIAMCSSLDERVEKLAGQLEAKDPARANRLRSEILFEVRQRHGDLLTQMAVSQQSYAILRMIETNNLDLVKGIDRASATTIAALQTAIVAAQTLANQNLVLDRINGVRTAASSLIEQSSRSTVDGNRQVALESEEASRQIASLRTAFADVVASVDSLERQQQSALSSL
jgi:uncharacterized protein YaaN involved in tellurite resistance